VVDEQETTTTTEAQGFEDEAPDAADGGPAPEDGKADRALAFVRDIVAKMGVDAEAEVVNNHARQVEIDIAGPDASILIGKRGSTLFALQFLTNRVVNRGPVGRCGASPTRPALEPLCQPPGCAVHASDSLSRTRLETGLPDPEAVVCGCPAAIAVLPKNRVCSEERVGPTPLHRDEPGSKTAPNVSSRVLFGGGCQCVQVQSASLCHDDRYLLRALCLGS